MKYTRVVPFLLVSSLVFGGCSLGQQIQQAATQKAITAAADAMFQGIDDPLVKKYLIAQFAQRKYRVMSESGTKAGGSSSTELDFSDTSTVKMHITATAGSKEVSNMIIIGDTTYVKNEQDGTWWKQVAKKTPDASPVAQDAIKFDPEAMKKSFEDTKATTTYKSLGQEVCGNLNCYKYEENHTDNSSTVRTFWFDDKEYLLRKEEVSYGSTKTTTTYSYDNINVTEPSPTKDVPEGKSAFEMMYAVPSESSKPSTSTGETGKVPTQEEINQLLQQNGGGQQ